MNVELFELYLSPIDETRFTAIVTQSTVSGDGGDTQSALPDSDKRRITIVKTLEFLQFKADDFQSDGELDWMVAEKIILAEGNAFLPDYLARIGNLLYKTLFPPGSRVEKLVSVAIANAESKGKQLVLRLKFPAEGVQRSRLADYPWELLHDGRRFLCHHNVELSRYIAYEGVVPKLPPVEKLNVLLVSSEAFNNEMDLKRLSRKEREAIRRGLEKAEEGGHICLRELEAPTFNNLMAYLTENRGKDSPQVVHFDGHGLFGQKCQKCGTAHKTTKRLECRKCGAHLPKPQGYLAFEDEEGEVDWIAAAELGSWLQKSALADATEQTGGVVLAVLSACQSGMAVAGESLFNGAAQKLIEHGVPAVVAMQYSVRVDSATKFAEQFYRSLGQKNSLSVAVSQGRAAMGVEGNQWYRPVLYLRWDNESGKLFAPSRETPKSRIIQMVAPHIDFSNNSEENLPDLDFSAIPPESIQQAYRKALPPDANLWDDLEENDISQILEILKEYRCEGEFYQLLSQDENIDRSMGQKIQEKAKKYPQKNKERQYEGKESYLIATLQPVDDEFRLNGWLVIGEHKNSEDYVNHCKSLVNHDRTESGIKCQLDRVESLLDNFIEQCFNFLPKDHQLIIEVFLPIHLLDTKVEWWNFTEFDYKKRPIGTEYSVRLRSVERLERRYLDRHSRRWKEKWDWVKSVLEKKAILEHFGYFDSAKNCDFTEAYLINQLDDKIGVKLMSCPPEHKRRELFMAIMKSALPIALWTRYYLDNRDREIEQFLNLQKLSSVCDSIRKKRLEAFAEPDEVLKNNHLGSHLAVIWENPYRLTPDLIELTLPGE